MIESPLIREIVAEVRQKDILKFLTRFGPVPPELAAEVRSILDETILDAVVELLNILPRPGTLPGGDAGDSQAPGALGPRLTSPSPTLEHWCDYRRDACSLQRDESGTGRVIDRAGNALTSPFSTSSGAKLPPPRDLARMGYD